MSIEADPVRIIPFTRYPEMEKFKVLHVSGIQRLARRAVSASGELSCWLLLKQEDLKNVGPIPHCEPPLHCHSPGVATVARQLYL